MTNGTPEGVLLKGADGSYYFIPETDLSQYAAPQVTNDARDQVAETAPRLDAFAIDSAHVDPAVAMIIGPDN